VNVQLKLSSKHEGKKISTLQNLFILYNVLKKQFLKLLRAGSILAVRIAKLRALTEPVRILLFLADQSSHIIKIGIKQSLFQTSLSIHISFKFIHAFVIFRLPKANTF